MGAAAGGDAAESPGDGLVTNRGPGTAAPASSTSCRPKMTHSRRQGQPAAITTTAACARAPPHPRHVARSGSGSVSLGVPLGEGPRLRGRRTLAPRPKGRRGKLTHYQSTGSTVVGVDGVQEGLRGGPTLGLLAPERPGAGRPARGGRPRPADGRAAER